MSHFNQVANTWDTPEKIELAAQYSKKIKEKLVSKTPMRILEIGCGTGVLGSYFVNDQNTLLGIDTSKGMLEIFNKKFLNNDRVQSLLINLEEEDLVGQHFDLVISLMAFHHLKSPENIFKKLDKLVQQNGMIAIIDLDQEDGTFHPDPANMGVHHFGFSKEVTENWAKNTSFKYTSREIIHTFYKNEKQYPLCMSVFIK